MMEEEQRPTRKIAHEIGQSLDDLSVHELGARIELLRTEIDRLEAARIGKQKALDVAGSVFGKPPS